MSEQSATGQSLDPADLACAVDRTLLAFYEPAALVVGANFRVVDSRGDLMRFGFAASLSSVPRGPLGAAIRRLVAAGVAAEETVNGTRITMLPINDAAATKLFCVLLQLSEESAVLRVHDLETRFAGARHDLATVLDDYGATTEELRAAYEELKSANEELHRLNEELTTSNQDLSSLNKLSESRSRELQRVNAELSNVLNSVGIPMLLLDMELRIRRFTPQAGRLFHLTVSKIGEPIVITLEIAALAGIEETCRQVLDTFIPASCPVVVRGRRFSMIVRPYRTEDNQIGGIVLALLGTDLPLR